MVKAPPEKVWETLRDFHDLSWAPDVVTNVDVVGDKKGHQPGAKRLLNGVFTRRRMLSMTITGSFPIASMRALLRFLWMKPAATRGM
ncbi:SRPBCC family protein [Vreelandella vilamensis]|uniref:SRPBCC family protein n=1 Tax=Vreelandella vilamensis TaxID=531309 RepID=UPI003BF5CE0A